MHPPVGKSGLFPNKSCIWCFLTMSQFQITLMLIDACVIGKRLINTCSDRGLIQGIQGRIPGGGFRGGFWNYVFQRYEIANWHVQRNSIHMGV